MNSAQWLLEGLKDRLPSDASQTMTADQKDAFKVWLEGIGNGIGNAVAHEIGHMLSLPDMQCGIGSAPPCPDNSPYYESNKEFFKSLPLQWTPRDAEELRKKLLKTTEPR